MRGILCVGLTLMVSSVLARAAGQDAAADIPAQSTASNQSTQSSDNLELITVTGSRIVRDGFEAPTPVTVIGAEQMNAEATVNIADALNRLPIVAGSITQSNLGVSTSNGEAGSNTLNLRAMGAGRTLVLFDGRRVVSVGLRGTTDVGQIPTTLVERIDIVTGGASAPYGSDAVTGIVNFVLDRDFTGFKANLMGGVSKYGDNEQYKGEFAFGTPFAAERGHFLVGAEYTDSTGIRSIGGQRPWAKNTKSVVNAAYTPTAGVPYFLVRPNAEFASMAPGLLITGGPLRGTEFIGNGETRPFQYGANVTANLTMEGGANTDTERTQLLQPQERTNLFSHVSFDVTDNVSLWTDFSYSETEGLNDCCTHFFPGNMTIRIDNPYLPAQIVNQMTAAGITSFAAGTANEDLPTLHGHNGRNMRQLAIGARGKFAALGKEWGWDAYAQRGISRVYLNTHQVNRTRWNLAIDAVRDPTTGQIVCRSTLTSPGNGCVPLNRFGIGTVTPQAEDYVIGHNPYKEEVTQDVAEISFTGEPFSTWADTVSIAFGAQYRKEDVESEAIPSSISNEWFAANFKPTFGSYDVLDGFMETVVPLARDKAWAKSLDLNAAVRFTDYSTSGRVETWKVGATYEPISQLRFRATQSRDIRSPGLGDLFRAGQVNSSTANDPFNGGVQVTFNRPLVGNPEMLPEKGDTTGFGVVYQPDWLPNFSVSADYFYIKVTEAFAIPDVQIILDRCFAGDQTYCGSIERDANNRLTFVTVKPLNADAQTTEGVDLEMSYSMPAWGGDLSLRALATHTMKNELTVNGVLIDVSGKNSDMGGYPGVPTWRWQAGVTYDRDPVTLNLTVRGISDGVINNAWIECTSGCPASTTVNRTVDDNDIAGSVWLDASIGYQLWGDAQAYLRVDNVLNKGAPPVGDDYFLSQGFNASLYDSIGRTFRAGVRVKF